LGIRPGRRFAERDAAEAAHDNDDRRDVRFCGWLRHRLTEHRADEPRRRQFDDPQATRAGACSMPDRRSSGLGRVPRGRHEDCSRIRVIALLALGAAVSGANDVQAASRKICGTTPSGTGIVAVGTTRGPRFRTPRGSRRTATRARRHRARKGLEDGLEVQPELGIMRDGTLDIHQVLAGQHRSPVPAVGVFTSRV
jgi:hypothetical protein